MMLVLILSFNISAQTTFAALETEKQPWKPLTIGLMMHGLTYWIASSKGLSQSDRNQVNIVGHGVGAVCDVLSLRFTIKNTRRRSFSTTKCYKF